MHISFRPGRGWEMGEETLRLPERKDDIEQFIAECFVNAMNKTAGPDEAISNLVQNHESNLDFTVDIGGKEALLELTEFAPLNEFGGDYGKVPNSYQPGQRAQLYLDLLRKKSQKQGGAKRILLTYATHDNFTLCMWAAEIVKRQLQTETLRFDAVYDLIVHPDGEGSIETVYPSDLNPELAKRSTDSLANSSSYNLSMADFTQTSPTSRTTPQE